MRKLTNIPIAQNIGGDISPNPLLLEYDCFMHGFYPLFSVFEQNWYFTSHVNCSWIHDTDRISGCALYPIFNAVYKTNIHIEKSHNIGRTFLFPGYRMRKEVVKFITFNNTKFAPDTITFDKPNEFDILVNFLTLVNPSVYNYLDNGEYWLSSNYKFIKDNTNWYISSGKGRPFTCRTYDRPSSGTPISLTDDHGFVSDINTKFRDRYNYFQNTTKFK